MEKGCQRSNRVEKKESSKMKYEREQTHHYYLHIPTYTHVTDSRGIHLLVMPNPLALRRTRLFLLRRPSIFWLSKD